MHVQIGSKKKLLRRVMLLTIMAMIGLFTSYAAANTYEVITHHDVPVSDVIKTVSLTNNFGVQQELTQKHAISFDAGVFGVPADIKFPESDKHIEIMKAIYEGNSWKGYRGTAQTFLTANARQKVFGQAFIYMRVNTLTTKGLGDVYPGDIVDVVTTQGWQLGYQVSDVAADVSQLNPFKNNNTSSQIIVILIDEITNKTTSFSAVLTKVGERV